MDEILRNTRAQLQVGFYSSGTAIDPDGDVTVTILGVCGGTIVAAGTAEAMGTASPGIYGYTLEPQTELDLFTATWTGEFGGTAMPQVTYAEVVGGYHVPINDVRALDGLSSYSYATLVEGRAWWQTMSEQFCGVAFVPRFGHDVLDGTGTKEVILDHMRPTRVRSAAIGGTAVADVSNWLLYDSGRVYRDDGFTFTAGHRNVEVCYEHGYAQPPSDLREAALVAIREHVLGDATGVPVRATALTQEFSRLDLAGYDEDHPTGIPRVDAVLMRYRERIGEMLVG